MTEKILGMTVNPKHKLTHEAGSRSRTAVTNVLPIIAPIKLTDSVTEVPWFVKPFHAQAEVNWSLWTSTLQLNHHVMTPIFDG